MAKTEVLVTFDSMKNPNSGYFSFGKGLGDALLKKNNDRYKLTFYIFRKTTYFNGRVALSYLLRVHRIFFPGYNKYTLVHFTDQTCRLRPYRVNAKRIMTIHDINKVHLDFSPPQKIKAHIDKLRKFISYCDRVVTISEFVARDILKYIPEVKDKLRVIYNGADKLQVTENHTPAYQPKKEFLFTIGLLSPQKGFHLLPALLKGNDYELVISGIETPHKAKILEEVKKHNCEDRVSITGPVTDDDKAWYYKNCSAFLFPSIAEGFGLPVIEAMHFGKPVFLSKYTSLPEIGGEVAYYFDNFEPEHMQNVFAKGMNDFYTNNLSAKVIAHADKFSWERTAGQYLQLYTDCING
ncbi:MAG: glycosyltransferase family 1 protein [Mucilaginibacter sp.]